MKPGRINLFLLLIILVTAGIIYLGEQKRANSDHRANGASALLTCPVDEIRYLRLEWADQIIEMEKGKDGWEIVLPFRDRASDALVRKVLNSWQGMSKRPVVGLNGEDDFTSVGLNAPDLRVSLKDKVERFGFSVGKQLPLESGRYVRIENEAVIYTVEGNLLRAVPSALNDFRKRDLFAGSPDQVKRFEILSGGNSIQCVRDDAGTWNLLQPLSGRGDPESIEDFLATLYRFTILSFVADQVSDPGIYSIDERSAEIRLYLKGEAGAEVVRLGGALKDSDRIYAADSKRSSVFTIPAEIVDLVSADVGLFRDHRPVPMMSTDIADVTIRFGDLATRLQRTVAGGWSVFAPNPRPAADARVTAFLDLWTSPVILDFLTDEEAEAVSTSSLPYAELSFESIASESGQRTTSDLKIYRDSGVENSLAHLVQDDVWVRLPAGLLEARSVDPISFYSLKVLQIDPAAVTGFTLESSGNTQKVVRAESGGFTSDSGTVNAKQILKLKDLFMSLEALATVAQSPEILPAGYFKKDVERVTVHVSGAVGISRTLLLGDRTRQGSRYATLLGDPVVYLLSKETAEGLVRDLVVAGAAVNE